MRSFEKSVLETYVRRAMSTGTLADAAIAADYLAKVSKCKYADCMAALCKAYPIQYADRECKDRPSMYTAKNPAKDMLPVKYDRKHSDWTFVEAPANLPI